MYGSESYPLAAFEAWMNVIDQPYVIGDFVWTAFDYLARQVSAGVVIAGTEFLPWNLAYCVT